MTACLPVTATVTLVGAGPGDPDLLTVAAVKALRGADVVVHDRLVSREVLSLIPEAVPRIFVGKESGHHSLSQPEINALLVDLAGSYTNIVRLKGGDPFIFGRGGEEAETLQDHGIAVRVIPGITAAAAAGALCGMPLTHRGLATGVRFVTGHAQNDDTLSLNWSSLADPDTTLVVYMGLATLETLCTNLIAHGLSPQTPVLAIQGVASTTERRVLTALAQAPQRIAAEKLAAPTLLVIGRVAALASLDVQALTRPVSEAPDFVREPWA